MHEFPLILKHRSNPHASIVVMNADQLNSVPDEFAPDEIRKARNEAAGSEGIVSVEKQISGDSSGTQQAREDLDKRQAAFDKAVDDWTDQVRSQSQKLEEERAYLERDRVALDEQRSNLEQQNQQLQRDRAAFEVEKNAPANGALKQGETTVQEGMPETLQGEQDRAAGGHPSKRTRGSKE